MRKLNNFANKKLGMVLAGIGSITIAVVISVALYGTFWNENAEENEHTNAVAMSLESSHGNELAEEAHGSVDAHDDAATMVEHESESEEFLEITLEAVEGELGGSSHQLWRCQWGI